MLPLSAVLGLIAGAIILLLPATSRAECGVASVYWEGTRTANGERYHPDGISAAHKTLPFGTIVEVRNQRTGATIRVRINDRGPFIRGRIIDLSRGAARAFGMGVGLANVCLEIVAYSEGRRVASASARKAKKQRGHREEQVSFWPWE
ncbi:septal ring lytic transglycosylase RlpA family protein [Rhodomicrobium udaipurense]|uniref:Endolytic peptidoglycan transglycosylase RlpA n=1 Tax=Rhodomicrobium udaipurense TaxID=1202716 RepID=A0A8I1GG70_9HYPH|nr:septal ring lytic transglycosylase RlpA family protein [Rhodomicrobium udaipurense]MBJ7543261.1 septal ring lytic transglycosylase RlpA family protein [Rhodomicrobium udaipurense]